MDVQVMLVMTPFATPGECLLRVRATDTAPVLAPVENKDSRREFG